MLHVPFVLNLVLACVGMAVRDFSNTMETVAQSRGAEQQAARMDALQDIATAVITLTGAGNILLHGITVSTVSTIAGIAVTSYVGTIYWTRYARYKTPQDPVLSNHETRLGRVEHQLETFIRAARALAERRRGVEAEGRNPGQLEEEQPPRPTPG